MIPRRAATAGSKSPAARVHTVEERCQQAVESKWLPAAFLKSGLGEFFNILIILVAEC
jgi:hypothetical protein